MGASGNLGELTSGKEQTEFPSVSKRVFGFEKWKQPAVSCPNKSPQNLPRPAPATAAGPRPLEAHWPIQFAPCPIGGGDGRAVHRGAGKPSAELLASVSAAGIPKPPGSPREMSVPEVPRDLQLPPSHRAQSAFKGERGCPKSV